MPYRIVRLTHDSYDFVRTRVESGRYENASELVQAAFRALRREEQSFQADRPAQTIADGDVFRKLWEASIQSQQTRS
jgi:putative addiction module CopG family antidote